MWKHCWKYITSWNLGGKRPDVNTVQQCSILSLSPIALILKCRDLFSPSDVLQSVFTFCFLFHGVSSQIPAQHQNNDEGRSCLCVQHPPQRQKARKHVLMMPNRVGPAVRLEVLVDHQSRGRVVRCSPWSRDLWTHRGKHGAGIKPDWFGAFRNFDIN